MRRYSSGRRSACTLLIGLMFLSRASSSRHAAFTAAFGGLAPATRARHLSALRSALAWWAEAAGWPPTRLPGGRGRRSPWTPPGLTRAQVAAIWRLDAPLRDKALWRMLYETAARAEEILGLDVPDLDLPSKRGRIVSKGGTTDWVHWQTGTAMQLPRLLAGRRQGPVFLTARKPARAAASGDLCPVTLRARLSYRRAAESFELATRPLANPEPPPGSWRNCTAGPSISCGTPCSPTRPRTAPAPPCCSPGPRMPPSAPSSATRAPGLRGSPATSHAPTRPRGAASPDAKRSSRLAAVTWP